MLTAGVTRHPGKGLGRRVGRSRAAGAHGRRDDRRRRGDFPGRAHAAREALTRARLEPVVLGPKEGLALINGTQVSTALCTRSVCSGRSRAQAAIVSGALSTDAIMGSTAPLCRRDPRAARPPRPDRGGGQPCALMAGSQIRESHAEATTRVQDPYCIRCQPQVAGAALDLLRQAAATLEIEANAVTDNPLVLVGRQGRFRRQFPRRTGGLRR
jgi:histidine ammonia-lyase